MSKKKAVNVNVELNETKQWSEPPNPHVFGAKVIRTDKGAGLMVESGRIDGAECFVLRHLGTAACIPVGFDGAKALRVLLDEWITAHDPWPKISEWSVAK